MLMSEPLSVPVSAANEQLPVGLNGEIISRSRIGHGFVWPKTDPRSQWQPQRIYGPSDDARIRRLGISPHFDIDAFLERTKMFDPPSRIIELLNHNAFQFNSRKKFRECDQWRQIVTEACEKAAPIEVLILAFCVGGCGRYEPGETPFAERHSGYDPCKKNSGFGSSPVSRIQKLGSRLLPYHGIATLVPGDNDGAERMEIRHEITVIGNPSFTRVVEEKRLTQFYEPSAPSV